MKKKKTVTMNIILILIQPRKNPKGFPVLLLSHTKWSGGSWPLVLLQQQLGEDFHRLGEASAKAVKTRRHSKGLEAEGQKRGLLMQCTKIEAIVFHSLGVQHAEWHIHSNALKINTMPEQVFCNFTTSMFRSVSKKKLYWFVCMFFLKKGF